MHPCKQYVYIEWLSTLTGNYLENRKADTNKQVMYDGAAPLGICGGHSLHRCNLVEAAVDAKRTSRDRNIQCDLNTGCCAATEDK